MRVEQVAIPLIRNVVKRPRLAEVLFGRDRWGNPFDAAAAADPYPSYELMRADGPVVYRKLYQQWFVTGHDEARTILASDAFITSAQVDGVIEVRPFSQLSDQAKDFFRLWLLLVDPPAHTRLRGLVARAFTPNRVRALEHRVEQLAAELVADARSQDEPDVVATVCNHLPIAVIAELLGLPRDRWDWARRTTSQVVMLLNPFEWFDPDAMSATIAELHEFWGDLADQRRAEPRDDLLSALVAAQDDGDRLSRDELIAVVAFLLSAGHETTTNLLGNSIVHLARNPQQRELVRSDPSRWPNAVEELIRYDSSVKISPRAAARDVEVGGATIPKGANVLVQLGAANRDPRRHDRPGELLLDREDPSPISFGHGIHHCIGAALARMELRIGLSTFVDAFGAYEIDEAGLEWKASATLRGPTTLHVRPG